MDRAGRDFLQTPGPTPIPERVLNAMHRQPYDLVDPRLLDLTASCFADLRALFRTEGEVFIYSCNGHGGWEAVLSNLFAPGDRVVLPEMGNFPRAWAGQARSLGIDAQLIPGDWRRAVEPAALEQVLREDRDRSIRAVLLVHTDTATGITCDVPAYRKAIDDAGHPALLVVDAIASLGATPFTMDAWGIDVAISASQKALMCPPGLAFVATNQRALDYAKSVERPRAYWDWQARNREELFMRFCGTTPEHMLFGLRESLTILQEHGLDSFIARHARLAGAVHRAVEAWSTADTLSFNAVVPAERSNSVTAIRVSDSVDAEALRRNARENFSVSLGGGLGALEGHAFRIGHLGDSNEPTILGCLGAVEATFIAMGIAHGDGALRAAAEFLADSSQITPAHAGQDGLRSASAAE